MTQLKSLMDSIAAQGWTAYLLPQRDEFLNESPLPEGSKRLQWATGFTGSAGTAVVTPGRTFLFVDGRYTTQAQQETSPELVTIVYPETVRTWLQQYLKRGDILALDPRLHSVEDVQHYQALAQAQGWTLTFATPNPVDTLWTPRPSLPAESLEDLPWYGRSFQETCAACFTLDSQSTYLLCAADEIAWLLNLRSTHKTFTPHFRAYASITYQEGRFKAHVFTPPCVTGNHPDIIFHPFDALDSFLHHKTRILYDPFKTPYHLIHSINASWEKSPSALGKVRARKTPAEVEAIALAHQKDGVAIVKFLHWLSERPLDGSVTEHSAAQQLQAFRSEDPAYRHESFATISAFGKNSAIIHYHPSATHSTPLKQGIYLLDCGGQYWGEGALGTTDVTRTLFLGQNPSSAEKALYTLVLQAHIHLANAQFPSGTRGCHLDVAARSWLWQEGLDYPHSTGHGVGLYLSVHESPPSLSLRAFQDPIEEGMVFSNEPGYYQPDLYGFRLESLVTVRQKASLLFLETLTLVPFDRQLIDSAALTPRQRQWIDQYHHQVYTQLAPLLSEGPRQWLCGATQPLG